MKTIHPKKIKSTNKSPEIMRFVDFLNTSGLSYADIADSAEVSERTVANYVHQNIPIGGQLLRGLLEIYGVSVNWLLSGKGDMYIDKNELKEFKADYSPEIPLIKYHENTDVNSIQDFWWLTAKATEQSLIQSGAKPNQDYSLMDLYKLSQPFVVERFKKTNMDVSVYPD